MRIVIVDDEYYSMKYLEGLCEQIRGIEIIGEFQNAFLAIDFIKQNKTDIIFMDIEMPGISGIEAVKHIKQYGPIGIIFVTGYEQYALEAFRLDAVSYLMKPCSLEDVENAVKKAGKLYPKEKKRVEIKTFGNFLILVDEQPIQFSNSKAKELLALLVDAKGASVTIEQAADIVWEGHAYDETVKQLYRKAVGYLNKLCQKHCLDFFESRRGSCCIIPSKVDCDLYRFLDGEYQIKKYYYGEYMMQYSWAEATNGKLMQLSNII